MYILNEPLAEDMHVHSRFSDGMHTAEENVRQAEQVGLKRLCCVDHVRTDTDWVADFVREIDRLKTDSSMAIYSGVETKLLNRNGDLDIPADLTGVDFIYVADHQFPLGDLVYTPAEIRNFLAAGEVGQIDLIESLAASTINALHRHRRVILAHLFSILPKIGISEDQVPDELLEAIARAARETGAQIEIDERWKCPSARTVAFFLSAGVPLRCSTDSHRKEKIGQYQYNRMVIETLEMSAQALPF